MKKLIHVIIAAVLPAALLSGADCARAASGDGRDKDRRDALMEAFTEPPQSARPRVWWHWMNGNISKEGIRKDLLWMKSAGIAGFHNFDAGFSVPQVVEERLPFMSEKWKDAFRYTLDLADSLGLEVTIASSAGWSVTGGPWVSEDQAMKKLVWKETLIEGGQRYRGPIDTPPDCCGEFLDIRRYPDNPERNAYYRDIAVVAVRMPDNELTMNELAPSVSCSSDCRAELLTDGDRNVACEVGPGSDGYARIVFDLSTPRQIKALTLARGGIERNRWDRKVECSDDGISYRSILEKLPPCTGTVYTFDIEPVTARYIRISANKEGDKLGYTEISLHTVTRVNIDTEKSGFFSYAYIRDLYPTPETGDAIPEKNVIDLSRKYRNGVLDWKVPEGRWKVYRFGYNLTGKQNGPASPEATGLEVDKLDADAVRNYYEQYLEMYDEASGHRLGSVLSHIMIDSYEARCQTWTARMPEEFARRRGYSLVKWLPAIAGEVIGSSAETERFLSDWRLTLGELMAECHYDAVDEVLARYGMKRHTESHEYTRAFVGDGMDVKRHADIPMSAFWVRSIYASDMASEADIHESASVCHIYGQKVCAAESFTADAIRKYTTKPAWSYHPGSLKPNADAALASGLNRFIIHCSTHQPEDKLVPGLALSRFGQWFTRKETWADEAKCWTDYLSRSCAMMQQGRNIADIAYFYAETQNATSAFKLRRPDVPKGYSYDFVNRTIVNEVLVTEDNTLVAPTGARYSALFIDSEVFSITTQTLRSIARFADAGVLIVGNEPRDYADLKGDKEEFDRLVKKIWHSGKRNVRSADEAETALREAGIGPDAQWLPDTGADIRFVHRCLEDGGHMYWIANISPEYRSLDVSLRVSGLKPELWHADTGIREDAGYVMDGDRTVVHLDMVPDDAVFIVLRERTDCRESRRAKAVESEIMRIRGPWDVRFQQGRGAPEGMTMKKLHSYTEEECDGIRYFSGSAWYTNSFEYNGEGGEIWLDLGDVRNMARVILNGRDLGNLWKKPYRTDVSQILRQGTNTLEIKVINSWTNRLIGDLQPGMEKVCYTPLNFFEADDELLPSGLLGPVKLITILK